MTKPAGPGPLQTPGHRMLTWLALSPTSWPALYVLESCSSQTVGSCLSVWDLVQDRTLLLQVEVLNDRLSPSRSHWWKAVWQRPELGTASVLNAGVFSMCHTQLGWNEGMSLCLITHLYLETHYWTCWYVFLVRIIVSSVTTFIAVPGLSRSWF